LTKDTAAAGGFELGLRFLFLPVNLAGEMYDYVCSKHKAYAKATRTTAEGAEGDPGIGQPTRRCSPSRPPFICIAKFAHVQIEIYDAE